MRKLCILLCLCLCTTPALAGDSTRLNDDLATRLFSGGTLERMWGGCGTHKVIIFTLPEPSGTGERLFVGYVDDGADPDSKEMLLRGPVATRWSGFRPAPGYPRGREPEGFCRYWADRLTAKPGGKMHNATVGIDLGPAQPLLRSVSGAVEALGPQEITASAHLLLRGKMLEERVNGDMRYRVSTPLLGEELEQSLESHAPPKNPLLVALAEQNPDGRRVVHVLPPRYWWARHRIVSAPSDPSQPFVFEVIVMDMGRDAQGQDAYTAKLLRVWATWETLRTKVVSVGWVPDSKGGWLPPGMTQ